MNPLTTAFKVLTQADDYIRMAAMTLLAWLTATYFNFPQPFFAIIIVIGIAIDVHNIFNNFIQKKPIN